MAKSKLIKVLAGLALIYAIICTIMFSFQESLLFFPQKLPEDYKFRFDANFEEIWINAAEDTRLHGILFKADSSKGLIFYLHGNAGSLESWGEIATTYTDMNYDLFILDYRGYGKSEGHIKGEQQFYEDVQVAYDQVTPNYSDKRIVVLGYSIGTGAASWLASKNDPDLLILQAPYYSIPDMKDRLFPFIPDMILKYKFENFKHIQKVASPIVIFHGDADEVIPYESSIKLREHFKPSDVLYTLEGQPHNGMSYNPVYQQLLRDLLTD